MDEKSWILCPRSPSTSMRALVEGCQPGAGSASSLVPELRLRRVRKWLLSHIRAHGRCSMDALIEALLIRVQVADANHVREVIGQASRTLCVEGRAFFADRLPGDAEGEECGDHGYEGCRLEELLASPDTERRYPFMIWLESWSLASQQAPRLVTKFLGVGGPLALLTNKA
ncbi:unnamed protein product, partial [Symbiodinium microadriaticum]